MFKFVSGMSLAGKMFYLSLNSQISICTISITLNIS